MKIVFVANEYIEPKQPKTGFPSYLYRVSLALKDMGHEPIIFAGSNRNYHRNDDGIEVYGIKVGNLDIHTQWARYFINELIMGWTLNKNLREYLKKNQADIIQFTSLAALPLFYYGKVPAVMRLSSYARLAYSTYQTLSKSTVEILALLERMSAKRCVSVFAPSKKTALNFGQDCRRKVAVIETPYVNDVEKYNECYSNELKGVKYVLYMGILSAEKGIEVIGNILERFLEKNRDYHFVFVGKDQKIQGMSSKKWLKNAAGAHSDRLIFYNAMPHECLYPVIMRADFVVLPSFMENLSNACIEAMYFSKIVVGTDGASFEQLIASGNNGFLCEIGNSEDLLKKMMTVVTLEPEQKRMMEFYAHKRIERLKPDITVSKLLKYYQYVINYASKHEETI